MPKTTNAVPQACLELEIQPNCTGSWSDIGGEMMTVEVPEMTRTTGSVPVFNDDEHVIAAGKKEPITVTFRGLFTDVATEAFELVRQVWETEGCRKGLCVRWSPQGGSVGDKEFEMMDKDAELVMFQYPGGDASAGEPVPFAFAVFGYIATDTIAS